MTKGKNFVGTKVLVFNLNKDNDNPVAGVIESMYSLDNSTIYIIRIDGILHECVHGKNEDGQAYFLTLTEYRNELQARKKELDELIRLEKDRKKLDNKVYKIMTMVKV